MCSNFYFGNLSSTLSTFNNISVCFPTKVYFKCSICSKFIPSFLLCFGSSAVIIWCQYDLNLSFSLFLILLEMDLSSKALFTFTPKALVILCTFDNQQPCPLLFNSILVLNAMFANVLGG